MQSTLGAWLKWRDGHLGPEFRRPPDTIVFYRDGVSEGEYERVFQYEIPMMKSELFSYVAKGRPDPSP